MNTQPEPVILLQAAEATPLEDRSLPASETLEAQQTEAAENGFAPFFVP